jgi:hypothetical protein
MDVFARRPMALKIAEEGIGSSLARYFEGAATHRAPRTSPPIEGSPKSRSGPTASRFRSGVTNYDVTGWTISRLVV